MELIRGWLRTRFPDGSSSRWVLSGLSVHGVFFVVPIVRSLWATYKLTKSLFPIRVRVSRGQSIVVERARDSQVRIRRFLSVATWGGCSVRSSIVLFPRARLEVSGEFEIGPDVHIEVGSDAILMVGGRGASTGSGITCRCRIMVEKEMHIGEDSIIAWDTYLTDSDWHDLADTPRTAPVVVGRNVWIAHGASVLKGVEIEDGCIVGAKALVTTGHFPARSLIAGVPARVLRSDVKWSR